MFELAAIEEAIHRLYIAAPGTALRKEDHKKAAEIAALLSEIARVLPAAKASPVCVVDAAAGKAYVGLLAAEFIFSPRGQASHVTLIERDRERSAACREAIAKVRGGEVSFALMQAEVGDFAAWPEEPDLVVALHACGSASDDVIDSAVACRARHLLLVPCCTSQSVSAAALANTRAEALGLPRHAEIRRRFIQAIVDAERTLRLEAAGYETTVVSFVAPTVTPHHLLWRARRVVEPGRMAEAAERLRRLRGE
jgi:hypothetical protein